jgi:hypothetical protein
MRIKTDEDLPHACVQRLRDQQHDAVSVVEQAMGGWKDPALWRAVQRENRFPITDARGFADVRAHPPGTHVGVLLLRPDQDGIRPMLSLLDQVLVAYDIETLAGTVAVATARSIRIRRTGA